MPNGRINEEEAMRRAVARDGFADAAEAERLTRWALDEIKRLRDRADELASALYPFAGAECACYGDSTCQWCRASDALQRYRDA
jgi:hypothetical protein